MGSAMSAVEADGYADIPELMRRAQRWLLYRLEASATGGKPRKVPFYADGVRRNGRLDSPEDIARLVSFEAVLTALEIGDYAGLGFALGPDGEACWQGVDFDDVAEHPALHAILEEIPGYTETSPSGQGIHAIGRGRPFTPLGANGSGIEAYPGGRFFTVTGVSTSLGEITDLADYVEKTLAPLHRRAAPEAKPQPATELDPASFADLRSALNALRSDDRTLWIKIGHALHGLGDVGRELWLTWSQTSEKFDPADAARTWDSFRPQNVDYRTVFMEAQRRGWTNPKARLEREPAPRKDVSAAWPMSEDVVALAFAAEHAERLRYDHKVGHWFVHEDGWWREDQTKIGFDRCRQMARQHAQTANKPATRTAMGKKVFAAGVEAFAQADQRLAVTPDCWNPDPWVAGVPGGVLDLRTGKVRPATPEDMITRRLACAPDDTVDCKLWNAFMRQFCEGDDPTILMLEQWFGMCLTGDTSEQKILVLNGSGGNGKGVLLQTVSRILGAYAVEAAPDTFTATHNEKHSTYLAMLAGARLVTTAETEAGHRWAEARIKQMSGGDQITARFMRRDFFTYTPAFKVVISTNSPPVMNQIDDALRRRLFVVPCRFKPETADPELGEKLWSERAGILRRLVNACREWKANGLAISERVLTETAAYFDGQDTVQQWLDADCNIDPKRTSGTATNLLLFRDWQRFAQDRGEDPRSDKWLRSQLINRGFRPPEHTRHGKLWHGLSLRPTGLDHG
jgi:putative DNA primase/helicase